MQDFGDMITVKIKAGCRWPYLPTDRNHFLTDTTRPLGEHLRQVLKKKKKKEKKIRPVVLEEMRERENVNGHMDGRMGRMDARWSTMR